MCLAFATWCFLNTWVEYAQGRTAYFAHNDPLYAVAIPVLCCEALIALALLAAWEVCRHTRFQNSRVPHLLFLGSCFVPFGIAAVAMLSVSPIDVAPLILNPHFWPVLLAITVILVAIAAARPLRASRGACRLFLYSWPVLAIILFQAGRATLFRYPTSAYADGPLAAPIDGPLPAVRVIWIIFDELSQTIAYTGRPAGLDLPNLDRLKSESLYATAATSPANATALSMPALIMGRPVTNVAPRAPNDLRVMGPAGSTPFSWSSVPNVFDQARQLGMNTALVGWDHPYGRLLNRSLIKCFWTAGWLLSGVEESFEAQSLPQAMWFHLKLQVAVLPLLGHLPGVFPGIYEREDKARRFEYMMDRARDIVSDRSIGLALVHLPVPHPPAIYSRSTPSTSATAKIGYLDNVVLADRALGDLRRALDHSGLAGRTVIIVSADHGWRTFLWRRSPGWTREEEVASHQDTSGVPFLVNFPHQASSVVYTKPFNTLITSRLILDILRGRVQTPADAVKTIQNAQNDSRD